MQVCGNKFIFVGDWTVERVVGVQRYAKNILKALDVHLQKKRSKMVVELLVPKNASDLPEFKNIHIVKRGSIKTKWQKHLWQQLVFPSYVRLNKAIGIDLAMAFPLWGCDIYAVHDCIHEVYPENFVGHKLYRWLYLFKVKCLSKRKKVEIVTPSAYSKKQINKIYGVPKERITLVCDGWEHMNDIKEDEGIFEKLPEVERGKFFFSIGSRYKHKNHKWVVNAAVLNPDYKFVVSGTDIFSEDGITENPENLIYTGYISDGEIKALYKNSRALIQPSLMEGFGLPPLEALAVGGEAIVSNSSCLPEIYEDTVYYLDPYSEGADLNELMCQKISDPEKVLQKYNWKNAAKRLLRVMCKVQMNN